MGKKKGAPINPEKLAKIARDYWMNGFKQSEISTELGVNQSTVAHWLSHARTTGVVAIDIDPDFALAGTEHRELSRRLRDAFGLRECLVVDPGDESFYSDTSDKLHTVIANTSGIRLREWIQSGDHIVIGGGRATVKVARFIKRTPPPRREIRISPLSGRIWTGSWQENGTGNLQRPLDADDAARLLAMAYEHEPGTRFSQVGYPLYEDDAKLAAQLIKDECVFGPKGTWKTEWGFQAPVRALVGVGVLHPKSGHRISELLNSASIPGYKVARHLKRAALKYKAAIDFAGSKGLLFFGDVANRLFPAICLPSELDKDQLPAPKHLDDLREKLDELNDHAVVMEWEHLRRTPSVWALAGGPLKVQVLWTLLICKYHDPDKAKSVIKELSTDLKTAEQLERALRDFEAASPKVRDWYRAISSKIFA
jgi:DNA-binding transcriptional regulator LsrR (DeoR family)